jgi:hypothetical protein
VLVFLLVVALVWNFVVEPRRARLQRAQAAAAAAPRVPPSPSQELVRSLERMEADLGELRAEVERMKGYVSETEPTRRP